ncbi:MAG: sensor histidine kinase [Gelidibacter sp.]
MLKYLFLLFFGLSFQIQLPAQEAIKSSTYDSIVEFRKLGSDASKTLEERYKYAKKAVELSNKTNSDSLILKSTRVLSTVLVYQGKYDRFINLNHKILKLSKKLNDSLEMGLSSHNIGWAYLQSRIQNDSAYYYLTNAIKIYEKTGKISNHIDALQSVSDILQVEKDYLGSEEYAIEGLKLLEKLPKDELNLFKAWNLYNILGTVSLELKQYDESIAYHHKAQDAAKKMDDGLSPLLSSQNNIAFVYKEKGDIQKALDLYQGVLDNKYLFDIDPTFYALASDNVAYTSFLNGDKNYDKLEKMFKRAYKIADSMEDPITKLASTVDMAKFYKAQGKIDSSLKYANETYRLGKLTKENDILLESMIILSQLIPGDEGKKYLNEHIQLSDSLLQHERGVRNKFARVQYETDQIEQENERISTQRFWLLVVSSVLLVTLFLLYVIITQRAKNKELKFEREQQQTNEEIYNLMLSQQDKVDEARAQEKKRISEEMHDGVLGRLFGTRLSLDSLNYAEGKEAMKKRSVYIDDLKNIEQDIRKISHDLNTDFVSGSGFMDIVETLIQNQTQAYQLTFEFYHSDAINWEGISNKTKIHIYRILQETMQNIYKHAEANHIKISFHLKNDVILLTINDDGKGFDITKSKKGIGLKNINSRVEEVNGTVQFDSEIDKGTTITIQIPYSK